MTAIIDRPKTVAVLLDVLEHGYQSRVLTGAARAALEEGLSLVCYLMGDTQAGNSTSQFDIFRGMFRNDALEGLILMSGALSRASGVEAVRELAAQYHQVPTVSIGAPLDATVTLMADNGSGIDQTIRHLVVDERRRRIAFIRGPEDSPEAEQRFDAYKRVLPRYDLKLDPTLVRQGRFTREGGVLAIEALCADRPNGKLSFDAVVAANDEMALGALKALLRAEVRVPDDVSLVGFDDIEESSFAKPSLTTVRQPLAEQGDRAVRLIRHWNDAPLPASPILLPTELIARQSSRAPREVEAPDPRAALLVRLDAAKMARTLNRISRDLINPESVKRVLEILAGSLRGLDVRSCHLFLEDGATAADRHVRCIFAHRDGVRAPELEEKRILLEDVLGCVLSQAAPSWRVVQPMAAGGEILGVMVFEVSANDQLDLCEELGRHVATALLGALLRQRETLHRLQMDALLRFRSDIDSARNEGAVLRETLKVAVVATNSALGFGIEVRTEPTPADSFSWSNSPLWPPGEGRNEDLGEPLLRKMDAWLVGDTACEPSTQALGKLGIGSILRMPVRAHGAVVGAVALLAEGVHTLSADSRAFVETLSAHAGGSIERLRLRSALREIGSAPATMLRFYPSGKALMEEVMKLGFDGAAIWTYDEYADAFEPLVERNLPPVIGRIVFGPAGFKNDYLSALVMNRQTISVFGEQIAADQSLDAVAAFFTPVIRDRGLVGALGAFGTFDRDRFRNPSALDDTKEELEALARKYAANIDSARPQAWLSSIAQQAISLIGAGSASVHLWNRGNPVFQAVAGNVGPEFLREFRPRPNGIGQRVREKGQPIVISDPGKLEVEHDAIYRRGVRALGAFPLRINEHLDGVLYVHFWEEHQFDNVEQELVGDIFAREINVAIGNYFELRRLNQSLAGLQATETAVGAVTRRSANVREVFGIILMKALELTGATHGHIYWYNSLLSRLELVADETKTYRSGDGRKWDMDPPRGIVGHAAARRHTCLAEDVTKEPWRRIYKTIVKGTTSELAVPLRDPNHLLGIINLEHPRAKAFNQDDQILVEALADLGVIALYGAELQRQTEFFRELGSVAVEAQQVSDDVDIVSRQLLEGLVRSGPLGFSRACLLLKAGGGSHVLTGWRASQEFAGVGELGNEVRGPRSAMAAEPVDLEHEDRLTALAECLRSQRIVMASTLESSLFPGRDREQYVSLMGHAPEEHSRPLGPFACIPLLGERGAALGALIVEGSFFERAVERLVLSSALDLVGSLAASTIENVLLRTRTAEEEKLANWKEVAARSAHAIGHRLSAIEGALMIATQQISRALGDLPERAAISESLGHLEKNISAAMRVMKNFRIFPAPVGGAPSEVKPAAILRRIVAEIQPSIEVPIELQIDCPDVTIAGNAERLGDALIELLRNADDMMAIAGSRRRALTVRLHLDESSTFAIIEVRDTGPGVRAADKDAIFRPFFTQKQRDGTGLGLAIVKEIVGWHGGSIAEIGKEGRGALFVVRLPALRKGS